MQLTPFSKILIANRGEIALRVMRSARALGYRTVAVYSTADAQSAHVLAADQAVCIGEPLPAQSYLRIPAILEAARVSGADAVHPGYGFLAENEDFAAACRDPGLVFIGPSPEAIRSMGDEEAPSPAVGPELRARMGATAVAAAKAIRYEGAGTLEFLLDREGHYYFMEMNTRLQVEHPVTEAITGLDLVEWQLRVAAGEPLPLAQEDIRFSGHAIEVRLCAEDVPAGFMPQSGTMRRWQVPQGLRVEHGLRSGATIPPFYDSMIAKLIAHGSSREEARRRLLRGVEDTVALGVRTNQEFLARCLAHPVFAAGGATTAFIAQHEAALVPPDEQANARAAVVGAWLLQETAGQTRHSASGRSLAHTLPLSMRFSLDGAERVVSVSQAQPDVFQISIDGEDHVLESVSVTPHEARFILDGMMDSVAFDRDGTNLWLRHAGRPHVVEDRTRATTARREEGGGDGRVRASMNGRVVAIQVAVGDKVAPGQPVVTLEAMKMEHVHMASVHGVVTGLLVAAGEQVDARRIIVEIAPETAEGVAR